MSLEGFAVGCVSIVGVVLFVYILARVCSAAFFRSKADHENRSH